MKLKYKIEILSDWHIGAGLDSATDADALVLKNDKQLPYIPGKTIKGLVKDAVRDLIDIEKASEEDLKKIFGKMDNPKEGHESHKGKAFFSDANLTEQEQDEIFNNKLSDYLYRNIASTAIDKNGLAKDKSLRVSQITMPLQVVGYISDLEESDTKLLKTAFQLIRHFGVGRNRGLGRCKFYHFENKKS